MTADVLMQSVHQPTGGAGGVVVPTCTACCLSLREAFYHLVDQNIQVAPSHILSYHTLHSTSIAAEFDQTAA